MNLYKINVEHVAPKDSHTSVECFLLAKDDEEVYNWIDKNKKYGCWTDPDDEELSNIYNKDYEIIGRETFKEKIIRIKGDINGEQDRSDAYYGLTFYGWEFIQSNPIKEGLDILKKSNILFEI